jgi:hypothetical protein
VRAVTPDAPGLDAGCCDVVLVAEVDHLLRDRTDYLRRLVPLLRPGGRIVVSNREGFEQDLRTAAAAASLSVTALPVQLPAHFALVLRPVSH